MFKRQVSPSLVKIGLVLLFLALTLAVLALAPVAAQEEEVGNVDIVLIIDTSGSMDWDDRDPDALRVSAAKLFVDLARAGDTFGIVKMGGPTNTQALTAELTSIRGLASKEALKTLIAANCKEADGDTYMGDALNLAYGLLENSPANAQRFVILLTDGEPDPPSQRAVVDEAVSRFQSHPDWPIFAIGLGAGADVGFLEDSIAAPTGGQAFQAVRADELVSRYLQVFELLLDDRYIEQVSVPANELAPVVSLLPEHRLIQLSFVVHRHDSAPTIEVLQVPDRINLAASGQTPVGVYYSKDKAYELYSIYADGSVPIPGDWSLGVQGTEDPALLTLMARSTLRTRLLIPRPSDSDTERSLRFLPAGRPTYIQVGALERDGSWVLDLQPAVELPADSGTVLVTLDDGQDWDLAAGDGYYAMIDRQVLAPGNYDLRVEVPRRNDRPIHLYKTYPVEILPLPELALTFVQEETTPLGSQDSIRGQVRLTPLDGISVDRVDVLKLAVRDPQGQEIPLEPVELNPTTFRFDYRPNGEGRHTFRVLAHVDATDGRRYIPYTDLATATFNARLLPMIKVSAEKKELNQAAGHKGTLTVYVASAAEQVQPLVVAYEGDGLQNLLVKPATITVPAGVTTPFEFDFYTDNGPGTGGQLRLAFSSPANTAELMGAAPSWQVAVISGLRIGADQEITKIKTRAGGKVTVHIASESITDANLTVTCQSSGLGQLDVIPRQITIPAGEETAFTFSIHSDAPAGSEGTFRLSFASDDGSVAIANDALVWQARVVQNRLGVVIAAVFVVLLLVIGLIVVVKRSRR